MRSLTLHFIDDELVVVDFCGYVLEGLEVVVVEPGLGGVRGEEGGEESLEGARMGGQ